MHLIRRLTALLPAPIRLGAASALLVALLLSGTALPGCSNIERADESLKADRARSSFQIDVPRIMRGTIASETVMLGYQSVLVSGYGLVVGLNGTGSNSMPPDVRAHMLQEIARRGVGQTSEGMGYLTGEALLDSMDTAVVIVEGLVPPAAVGKTTRRGLELEGSRFDVRVSADPRTGVTSLEGGRLYTCDLRPSARGALFPPTGSQQAAVIAHARGPIFINPFVEPGDADAETFAELGIVGTFDPEAAERERRRRPGPVIDRSRGKILAGGEVSRDLPLKLRLATPSHARAAIVQNAINTRFPREPGQTDETARGESDQSIRVTVPRSYRHRTDEFVRLLRHTSIRQTNPEAIATSVRRIVESDPLFHDQAALRWEALGPRAIPVIRPLYNSAEELARHAALRAGAKLDDPLTIPPLVEATRDPSPRTRMRAISLINGHRPDPRLDAALSERLNDEDVDVALAAYEALINRNENSITRYDIDGKFILDVVESDRHMIYVTQAGRPRIALFGSTTALLDPLYFDIWSGRLMGKAHDDEELVEVFYRPIGGGSHVVETTSRTLDEFIRFLARNAAVDRPDPGLGLTYAETIGALYLIKQEGVLDAEFRAAQDRIRAAIARFMEESEPGKRPEFSTVEAEQSADPDFEFLLPVPGSGPANIAIPGLDEAAVPPPLEVETGAERPAFDPD